MRDLEQTRRSQAEVYESIAAIQRQHGATIDEFHRVWYGSKQTWGMTMFENVPVLKNPMDMWVYQDLIWNLRPTLIVETGTAFGGSALFFARQLEKLRGVGHVVSIDVDPGLELPSHDRISWVTGSSVDPELVAEVRQVAATHRRVMVILDSDHAKDHVLAEMDAYAPMVTPGQFMVVEDTNLNGRPVDVEWNGGAGPGPAVDEWLPSHPEFRRDLIGERYLLTMMPGGWLRRQPPSLVD